MAITEVLLAVVARLENVLSNVACSTQRLKLLLGLTLYAGDLVAGSLHSENQLVDLHVQRALTQSLLVQNHLRKSDRQDRKNERQRVFGGGATDDALRRADHGDRQNGERVSRQIGAPGGHLGLEIIEGLRHYGLLDAAPRVRGSSAWPASNTLWEELAGGGARLAGRAPPSPSLHLPVDTLPLKSSPT